MPQKAAAPPKAFDIKRRFQVADRELSRLNELQWLYAKRLLRSGIIFWVFSLGVFFSAIIIINVNLLPQSCGIWGSLLIIGLAAPVIITAVVVRKFVAKIKYLERLRHTLLTEYKRAILTELWQILNPPH